MVEIRKQLLIPDGSVLNNGTVGSLPAPVARRVCEPSGIRDARRDRSGRLSFIRGYAAWNQFRDPLAEFVWILAQRNCFLLRNATEANSYIANGIDLKPGMRC
jgi:hypothetical protein